MLSEPLIALSSPSMSGVQSVGSFTRPCTFEATFSDMYAAIFEPGHSPACHIRPSRCIGVRRFRRDAKVEVASALMPLYPSALILRIFLYLLTSINYTGPSNAHNDGAANSRAFHRAEGRMERGCFGDDISDSVNFTKILAARQLRSCRSTIVVFFY